MSPQPQEEYRLVVLVPKNRNLSGRLLVKSKGAILRDMAVLARGSRGAGDTQFQKNGSTPEGEYDGSTFLAPVPFQQDAYGRYGEIQLKPISGNALIAEKKYGRHGLLIHGGTLGKSSYWRGEGELRATFGCLRVRDEDFFWLKQNLYDSHPKVTVEVLEK